MAVQTMFERVGGFATVRRIVSDFYARVLSSPHLEPYFSDVDMPRLVDHQVKFITAVTGGPAVFSDQMIVRAHAKLGITPADFDEMVALLVETLEDHELSPADVQEVERAVIRRRHLVVAGAVVVPGS
jgi:hemoglobin